MGYWHGSAGVHIEGRCDKARTKAKLFIRFRNISGAFGAFWFFGSWLMGALYDASPIWLVAFSVAAQLVASRSFGCPTGHMALILVN